MSRFARQLQSIVDDYRSTGMSWPATSAEIAEWAIRTRRRSLTPSAELRVCASQLARAMRQEFMTDPKGRRVRVKHPAAEKVDGHRRVRWDDIRSAPHAHMELSLQQRRNQIVDDCRQLKTDADSFNDSHPEQSAIQIVFNLIEDLAELEAAGAAT